ncbi:MAG: hypothetical protein R3E79_19130 [Caldilineaceae bacterium]
MDSVSLHLLSQGWALWIGFFFSLMLLSVLVGNGALAKTSQYLLVGISLGYLGVLLLQHVLRPRLLLPLWQAPLRQWPLWIALVLGILLWIGAADRLWPTQQLTDQAKQRRAYFRLAGIVPAALLIGVSVSALVFGLLQGTLWPQFWYTARSGFVWSAVLSESLVSVLVLLLTTASLLHWAAPVAQLAAQQPRWVQQLLHLWSGLGKRTLWFAAGVLFARLLAAHLSLVIGRLEFLLLTLQRSFLWQWAESLWRLVQGA